MKFLPNFHCVKSVQIRSFFWSIFSRILTEYGEIFRISLYSVRMRENTDQKKLRIWTLSTQCSQLYSKEFHYTSHDQKQSKMKIENTFDFETN